MSTTTDTTTESTDETTSDEIDALRDEVERLHHELAKARQRISDLEERVEASSTLPPAASDWRDARVLDALETGETLTVSELRAVIQSETDIRDSDTVSDRLRDLVKTDAFEPTGRQRWRYTGSGER